MKMRVIPVFMLHCLCNHPRPFGVAVTQPEGSCHGRQSIHLVADRVVPNHERCLSSARPGRRRALPLPPGVLGLRGIEVIEGRIEEIKDPAFDVAVTRALFDVKDFCRKALPLLKEGGRLVVSKGPRVNEELKAIRGIHHEVVVLPLPLSTLKRFIVVISKGVQETGTAGSGPPVTRGDTQARRGDSCINTECRLRKAGCMGFEGCPGFKSGA